MLVLVVFGSLLLGSAVLLRELQLHRERRETRVLFEQQRISMEIHRSHLNRAREDLFVLQATVLERGILEESDLLEGRNRLIEKPRLRAREQNALLESLGTSAERLLLDDSENVH